MTTIHEAMASRPSARHQEKEDQEAACTLHVREREVDGLTKVLPCAVNLAFPQGRVQTSRCDGINVHGLGSMESNLNYVIWPLVKRRHEVSIAPRAPPRQQRHLGECDVRCAA